MLAGTPVTIDGQEYIVPAISLGQLRNGLLQKLQQHDQLTNDGKIWEAMDIRAEIILAAIQRNYPDFTMDKLVNFLDMSNVGQIWLTVLGASGFTPGEAQAAR